MYLAVLDPPGGSAPPALSAAGIFALMLCALLVDYASVGPEWLRDRLAFLMGLTAIRLGWDGSIFDKYTVDTITAWIDEAKRTGNTQLAAARTEDVFKVLVGLLFLYCLGCLLPTKASAKLGRYALLAFTPASARPGMGGPGGPGGSRYRLNLRLWACAWLLGVLAELSGGLTGGALAQLISLCVRLLTPIPAWFFGVD